MIPSSEVEYSRNVFNQPLAYFISFRTYGTWLHGDERGSVDRVHNQFGAPMLPRNSAIEDWEHEHLANAPVVFGLSERALVEKTIRKVCEYKGWTLLALNVRSNHVHVVVTSPGRPEPVMNAFKAWATRRLTEAGLVSQGGRVWSRHGSTIYLFKPEKVAEKCKYVTDEQ